MLRQIKDGLKTGRGKKLVWLTAALLLITFGLTVSARTWLSVGGATAKSSTAPISPQINSIPQAPEQRVIRLLTSGFNPTELSGTSGQYRLVMTRPSRDEEVVLQLKTGTGEIVQELAMPQDKADWTTVIELQAGSYTLTVVNHPQWTCAITIQ